MMHHVRCAPAQAGPIFFPTKNIRDQDRNSESYGEFEAIIIIQTLEVARGSLPKGEARRIGAV